MPSNNDIHILSSSQLTVSSPMSELVCNGKDLHLTPQDLLENQANKWQVSMTDEQFARKLDENDPLKSFRNEFFYPKVGTLPRGILLINNQFLFYICVDLFS